MSYFTFLLVFLIPPIALLAVALRGSTASRLPEALRAFPPAAAVLLHIVLAVAYTTPWDNYLVATGVWYYDPALVIGYTFGWVPVEEYIFFVLQTMMTGMWLIWLAPRLAGGELPSPNTGRILRLAITAVGGGGWIASILLLLSGSEHARYLSLLLVWAIPPILLQLAFGADILWKHRLPVALGILLPTVYLSAADMLAIGWGTWTIAPEYSLGILLPGGLPIEELIFFLATNVLIVFGVTLVLSCASASRLPLTRFRWLKQATRTPCRTQTASRGV